MILRCRCSGLLSRQKARVEAERNYANDIHLFCTGFDAPCDLQMSFTAGVFF